MHEKGFQPSFLAVGLLLLRGLCVQVMASGATGQLVVAWLMGF